MRIETIGNAVLYHGDALEILSKLDIGSVQSCVTSPPYWGLRDYGVDGQAGLENTPEEYIDKMVNIFRLVRNILNDNGTLWLNLGDSYSGSGKGGNPEAGKQSTNKGSQSVGVLYGKTEESARQAAVTNVSRKLCAGSGIAPKQLLGIPWRVALALQADGWYLRSDIIWAKPNPMPESVMDRPTRAHEYIFLFSKSPRYYYDAGAIKEPMSKDEQSANGANKRDVWTVATQPYSGAHFATFPTKLIEPCILAGSRVGDVILDPFMGSGTSGEVALQHGRKFVGVELNEKYIDELAIPRIDQAQKQGRLFA